MTNREFMKRVEATPIIAAVKDDAGLEKALSVDVEIIFVLYGDLLTIGEIVNKIKDAGKVAMVHIDLVTGLNNSREVCVDFIRDSTEADGIITTRSNLIAHARELGLNTVLRYFILDSMALTNIEKQAANRSVRPDLIEFLPGIVLPKMIRRINAVSRVPIIAGGLISDREDVMNALGAGAVAISSTNMEVWEL